MSDDGRVVARDLHRLLNCEGGRVVWYIATRLLRFPFFDSSLRLAVGLPSATRTSTRPKSTTIMMRVTGQLGLPPRYHHT
jgi:hypothetical protein